VKKTRTRKEREDKIKKLNATVRRLRKQIKEMKTRDDEQFGLDGRRRPHYDGEFA
jgi:hypothetical protein